MSAKLVVSMSFLMFSTLGVQIAPKFLAESVGTAKRFTLTGITSLLQKLFLA